MEAVLFGYHGRTLIRRKILFRELRAALVAAAVQNSAAGAGRHTLHKAMLAGAVTFFWLVGSLGHNKIL